MDVHDGVDVVGGKDGNPVPLGPEGQIAVVALWPSTGSHGFAAE